MSKLIEKCARAIEATPLNLSSTTRAGCNRLRNADEIVLAVLKVLSEEPDAGALNKAAWEMAKEATKHMSDAAASVALVTGKHREWADVAITAYLSAISKGASDASI